MADKEVLEPVQAHLPVQQAAWLKARALKNQRSVSFELRKCVHLAMQVENLLAADSISYITVPAPEAAA